MVFNLSWFSNVETQDRVLRLVINSSFGIPIALHQTVIGIRLLFIFVISQAELEIHQQQNSANQQYKPTPTVSLQTENSL